MKLFHVQDLEGGHAMFVAADNWQHALDRWKQHVACENEEPLDAVDEPEGIALVAEEGEYLP